MDSSIRPVPLLLFLSVVGLIAAFWMYYLAGTLLFLIVTALWGMAAGWIIGVRWRMYPWQIGVIGAIPSVLFVLWRFFTHQTEAETAVNISLFVYHPLLVLATCHFGGLIGRWRALKKK